MIVFNSHLYYYVHKILKGIIMLYTIICVRNGVNAEEFIGTMVELTSLFIHTITHAYNVQKEYLKRKIPKKIPTKIEKFLEYLNDCTYNVTGNNDKKFILKACKKLA